MSILWFISIFLLICSFELNPAPNSLSIDSPQISKVFYWYLKISSFIAFCTNCESLPRVQFLSSFGPQVLTNCAHPYLPPGIALYSSSPVDIAFARIGLVLWTSVDFLLLLTLNLALSPLASSSLQDSSSYLSQNLTMSSVKYSFKKWMNLCQSDKWDHSWLPLLYWVYFNPHKFQLSSRSELRLRIIGYLIIKIAFFGIQIYLLFYRFIINTGIFFNPKSIIKLLILEFSGWWANENPDNCGISESTYLAMLFVLEASIKLSFSFVFDDVSYFDQTLQDWSESTSADSWSIPAQLSPAG